MGVQILDGALGTELIARGVQLEAPAWSANAIASAPQTVEEIHADYARAGATVHIANTFRTQPEVLGDRWKTTLNDAISIAKRALGENDVLLGSISPVRDCYRPDLSEGSSTRPSHRARAEALAAAGCDVLLCETFAAEEEALTAVEEALETGLPVWLSLTAGPDANLLTPAELGGAAKTASELGIARVLVNCVAATKMQPYVDRLAMIGIPVGAYANAGFADEKLGWEHTTPSAAIRYAELAQGWVDAGVTVVGGCCGTRLPHVEALVARFGPPV